MKPCAALIAVLVSAFGLAADSPRLSVKFVIDDPPKDITPALRDLLDARAVDVSDARGPVCKFWMRKEIPRGDKKAAPTYRSVTPGSLVGAVRFARPWTDFRTQEIAAGVYTLRLAVQPESKDHEGTAPFRDFCILVPAAADPKVDALPLKALIAMSGKATGGTHPVVMLLVPHPKPGAEPTVLVEKKRTAIGVRVGGHLGFGFTVLGAFND